ncbi:MAG: methyltransferase [Desulfobacterales bacterium]|nr:methyltransferase [Desulfobacterales bacterium]
MSSMDTFKAAYDTEIVELAVGGRPFRFHVPRTIDRFIDSDDPLRNFPLWSKVWEASLLLASKMASRPVGRDERLLELGAGLGVAGLVAAAFGHDVTITEYDPHALAFLEANRQENDCRHAGIRRLDWHQPDLDARFDVILGSELVYKESDFKAMRSLFRTLLKSSGEVYLAGEIRQTNKAFFDCMQSDFHIQIARHTLRSEEHAIPLLLIQMKPKAERS